MKKQYLETMFVVAAVAILLSGYFRAAERGDMAIRAWTTYFMFGMGASAGVNIFIRSRKVALAIFVFSVLFILLTASAAWMEIHSGSPYPPFAVIRGISFFILLIIVSWIQIRGSRIAGQPCASPDAVGPRR